MSIEMNTQKCLMVQKLTTNFRKAVTIEIENIRSPGKGEVSIQNKYVGINASDVNVSRGRYTPNAKLPFGVGFEGLGKIHEIGDGVTNFKVGQWVVYMNSKYNSFAEFVCVSDKGVFPIPEPKPEYLALVVSGLTASIGLDKSAQLKKGETVLITAAAGGAGHLAVQWAKSIGCHVIGTCSSQEKENALKKLGCDRVINYKIEDMDKILTQEYQDGINVIWETIGGKMFETCLKHLSQKGRLVIAGGITGYKKEDSIAIPKVEASYLPAILLQKSAAVQGYVLFDYADNYASYFECLKEGFKNGKLCPVIDNGKNSSKGEFIGMEGIIRGVEHLHSRESIGKIIARIH